MEMVLFAVKEISLGPNDGTPRDLRIKTSGATGTIEYLLSLVFTTSGAYGHMNSNVARLVTSDNRRLDVTSP